MTNWQNRMFRGKALPARHSQKPAVTILSWLFAFQSCAGHMLHFARKLLASYLGKLLALHFTLSFHTLSHTHNPYKKPHIKYRVHKIEQNYNQIWHGIKANTKQLQITTLQKLYHQTRFSPQTLPVISSLPLFLCLV